VVLLQPAGAAAPTHASSAAPAPAAAVYSTTWAPTDLAAVHARLLQAAASSSGAAAPKDASAAQAAVLVAKQTHLQLAPGRAAVQFVAVAPLTTEDGSCFGAL